MDTFLEQVWKIIRKNYVSFLRGAGTTILVALVGTLVGCVIGFICGILQTIPVSKNDNPVKRFFLKFIKAVISVYVEFFRGTPMIVQAAFIYYGSLMYFGIDMSMWFAAFFIVSINTGAYMAETVRGGILSVDIGQTEGAKAIGMNHFQTMYHVILPQALRNILPQIGNNLIINIKDTSVLSIISVTELFFVSKSVAGANYLYFETYFVTCLVYLVMTITCSKLLRLMEKRMAGEDTYDLATRDTLAHTSGMTKYVKKGDS